MLLPLLALRGQYMCVHVYCFFLNLKSKHWQTSFIAIYLNYCTSYFLCCMYKQNNISATLLQCSIGLGLYRVLSLSRRQAISPDWRGLSPTVKFSSSLFIYNLIATVKVLRLWLFRLKLRSLNRPIFISLFLVILFCHR